MKIILLDLALAFAAGILTCVDVALQHRRSYPRGVKFVISTNHQTTNSRGNYGTRNSRP